MHILPILLFVVSCSLDNFVVGLSYGIKRININFLNNLVVASISGVGTFISMTAGNFLCLYIPIKYSEFVGSIILIIFGMYFIIDSYRTNHSNLSEITNVGLNDNKVLHIEYYDEILKHPELVDTDNSNSIDIKESVVLGIALSLNNIGLGVGASIVGLNIYLSSFLSIIFSLIFVQIGFYFGSSVLSARLKKYAAPVSGLIIIALGLYELFL